MISAQMPRYDMGERDHFISLGMAAVGMEMMEGWGVDAVAGRLRIRVCLPGDGVALMVEDVPGLAGNDPAIVADDGESGVISHGPPRPKPAR